MTAKRLSVSCRARAEVGSSRIRTEGLKDIALAISTICCCPMLRLFTAAFRGISAPTLRRISPSLPHRGRPVDGEATETLLPGQPSQEDILHHRDFGDEAQLLVHHRDPLGERIRGDAHRHCFSIHLDGPAARLLGSRADLHERALAGAVLADQRVDFPALNRAEKSFNATVPGKILVMFSISSL